MIPQHSKQPTTNGAYARRGEMDRFGEKLHHDDVERNCPIEGVGTSVQKCRNISKKFVNKLLHYRYGFQKFA
jgi:hypothetical protein